MERVRALRVIVCVFHEFSAAASAYARYLSECGLSFTTASHNHSWLPLIAPETLVVSVEWSMNIISCMTGLHKFIYTENILLKTLQQILTDPDFDIPSQPAIAARKSASLILLWCSTDHDETATFLSKLQRQFSTCFTSTAKKMSTRKERMWELSFTVSSSPSFEAMRKEFLVGCGTDASATVYQHVTDIIFKNLLSK